MEQSARRGNAKMRRAMRRYVMKISECMSRNVQLATPDHSLQSAAQMMADIDTGFLPVADNDRLIGIVTDRDIAIRGVAAGRRPEASIRWVMRDGGKYCFDDQVVDAVPGNMGDIQVQVGRTSGRERVCQEVKVWVVPVH